MSDEIELPFAGYKGYENIWETGMAHKKSIITYSMVMLLCYT